MEEITYKDIQNRLRNGYYEVIEDTSDSNHSKAALKKDLFLAFDMQGEEAEKYFEEAWVNYWPDFDEIVDQFKYWMYYVVKSLE